MNIEEHLSPVERHVLSPIECEAEDFAGKIGALIGSHIRDNYGV